jgi:hypothetical protein
MTTIRREWTGSPGALSALAVAALLVAGAPSLHAAAAPEDLDAAEQEG